MARGEFILTTIIENQLDKTHKPDFCLGYFSRVPEFCLVDSILPRNSSTEPKSCIGWFDFFLGIFSWVPQFCLGCLDMRVSTLTLHLALTLIVIFFPLCLQALSCLVQIASVRRSLFNNAERAKFLNQLVAGVKDILDSPQVRIKRMICVSKLLWKIIEYSC